MRSRDTLGYSFSAIRLRKLRSGLTTLGIVIGIAAIVALLSFTQGFEVSITNQLQEGFSTDTLIVTSQNPFPTPGTQPSDFTLYTNDSDSIETIEGVTFATPLVNGRATVESDVTSTTVTLTGVNYTEFSALYTTTFVAEFGEIPEEPTNNSVVIGHSLYDPWKNGTYFADIDDSLTVTINAGLPTEKNVTLIVVGIIEEIGGAGSSVLSDTGFYVPMQTAIDLLESDKANPIIIKLDSDDSVLIEAVTADIDLLFDGEATVTSLTSILDTVNTMLGTVETLLGGIAAISLLVAGVGIMNIMIVSLMERTREIGILKALGAKGRTVLGVFLSEALLIGILGGIIGIIAGCVIANVFSGMMGGGFGAMGPGGNGGVGSMFGTITPVITPELMIMAMFYGVLVSVVFGLYPAWRASKLDPVDALRKD
ncbi:MAG: ABC transporter permease [Candidatus Thorarchaeota archaeon]|jgi:ABC-type antimicrobial peptide transport system permease subunit